ncbi:MAG: S-layer homology domain-containing protein [Clostridia bacterium]|nr:S-layer homology domain-containing protein [Clostridia bacterium]
MLIKGLASRLLAVLCSVTIFGTSSAFAAWDGYVGETVTDVSVLDFSSMNDIVSAGGIPSQEHTASGNRYSAHWANHTQNKDFQFALNKNIPSDWSVYTGLTFSMYSAKATGAKIAVVLYTDYAAGSYYMTNIKIDWEGDKKFLLKFDDMSGQRSPTWTNISYVRLVAHGNWSITGDPETDVYISDMYLTGGDKSSFIPYFYDKDVINQTLKDLKNSAAVYAGGAYAATEAGKRLLGYTADFCEGTVMVPVRLFSDLFKISVTDDGESFSADTGKYSISGKSGDVALAHNQLDKTWTVTPYTKDSMTYIPGEEAARMLGLNAYADKKLLVIGTEKAANAAYRPEHLGVNEENEIMAHLAFASYPDIDSITPEDCAKVKQNWIKYLCGSEEINDVNDPDIMSKIQSITSAAQAAWDLLIKEEGSKELFSGMNSTASTYMTGAYRRIYEMALAYRCSGSELYMNEELKGDILYGIEWMYNNRYGKNTAACEIWKFSGFNNWWDWDIGTPMYLTQTLIMMEDCIESERIAEYLAYFDKRNPAPSLNGGNFTEISKYIIASALLQNDYERVLKTQVAFEKMYLYVDDNERISATQLDAERQKYTKKKGAGFFTDGSYVEHTLHAMNGVYGSSHYEALSRFEQMFTGTVFEMKTPFRDNVPDIYLRAFDPLTFGTTLFRSVLGRQQNVENHTSGRSMLIKAFQCAHCFDDETRDKIYSMMKAAVIDNPEVDFCSFMTIDGISRLKAVLADDSIEPRRNRAQSVIFYNMDKAAHQRDDWSLGVSMSSSRIFNYESINGENTTGWYLADGRTEYYIKGKDTNGTLGYWKNIDPYRLPGTTVDTQTRKKASIAQGNEYLSSKDFVGGVMLEGAYSTAAMELESYHNAADFGKDNGSYGGKAPAHKSDLTAKKSYFMFDDETVCLGADIKATDNNDAEVLTIVENLAAETTRNLSPIDEEPEEYEILSAEASVTPEADNVAMNTIDGSYSTKWASEMNGEIVWDLGSEKELGCISLSFANGSSRKQFFKLSVSADGKEWTEVFDGGSSGQREEDEIFTLGNASARYVKFINKGNSTGASWVSLTECKIYRDNEANVNLFANAEVIGADTFTADGRNVALASDDYELKDTLWANMNDVCGYVFPKENTENNGALKARWTTGKNPYFELWFSHGVNPESGSYAYILLPGKTAEETQRYAENSNIRILANNKNIQAVENTKTGIKSIVFWRSGSFDGITVSAPCMVMYREAGDNITVSVSDPTQKLKSLTVSLDKGLYETEADDSAQIRTTETKTVITLDTEESCGRTFENRFSKTAPEIKPEPTDKPAAQPTEPPKGGHGGGSGGGGGASHKGTNPPAAATAKPENTANAAEGAFSDLTGFEWAKESIFTLCGKNIIDIPADGKFRPGDSVTREEFVKMLITALFEGKEAEEHLFTDAKAGEWYNKYISAAYALEIVKGYPDGSFGVGESITREDMAVMAERAMEKRGNPIPQVSDNSFKDADKISAYAAQSVNALYGAGVISGFEGGSFGPQETASRAQAARITAQLLKLLDM